VVVVVLTGTVEEVEVIESVVVVLAVLVVVGLGMVVDDVVLDEFVVVTVLDGGTSVLVASVRLVVV
jgi:hypothetical protein